MPNDQANALQAFHANEVLNPSQLDAAISSQRKTGPLAAGRKSATLLLRVDQRTGGFVYGQESVKPDPEGIWAVNPNSLQIGWVAWEDRKKQGELMAPVGSMPDCPDNGLDWKQQISFEMECLEGGDKGEIVCLSNSSNGALACWDLLLKDIATRPNVDFAAPVVKLGIHHYYLHKWNKDIYEPRLHVIDWMDANDGTRLSSSGEDIPFEDLKSETPAEEPLEEPTASASPVTARARRRSRNSD